MRIHIVRVPGAVVCVPWYGGLDVVGTMQRDKLNVARNGEEEKREKTPGNWCEESRFPGIAHPRVFWEIFF